jgi:hypothetical protein
MTRLDIVLADFITQEIKIRAVFSPCVSFVAIAVHTDSPLRDEMYAVLVEEAGGPAFADRVLAT